MSELAGVVRLGGRGVAIAAALAACLAAAASPGRAQTLKMREPLEFDQLRLQPPRTPQLTLRGRLASSVELSIEANNASGATGSIVDFGSFSTLAPELGGGEAFRVTEGPPGAIVTARVRATIRYTDASSGSITLSRASLSGTPPDVPSGELRVASPPLARWRAATDGIAVPDPGQPAVDLCVAAGHPTCLSEHSYEHQLAVLVPDTRPPGPLITAVVYAATAP